MKSTDKSIEKPVKKVCVTQTLGTFEKDDIILSLTNKKLVGILMEGKAYVSHLSPDGHENIVENLKIGDCFGSPLFSFTDVQDFQVIAASHCTVTFIDFDNVVYKCQANCENHSELVRMLLLQTTARMRNMSEHINILSQRTIRGKLLVFLEYQKKASKGKSHFRLSMNLNNLADYLCVDRAAMMREIKKLNDEEIITSKGREFTLNYDAL